MARSGFRSNLLRLFRAKLDPRPIGDCETLERLTSESNGPSRTGRNFFQFPWGELEYLDYGQMRSQFQQIFIQNNYSFCPRDSLPCIVDCGGNIGLSAIWFKRTYPQCKLIVYEADPAIAEVLERNISRAGFHDVVVRNSAVWVQDGSVGFEARGNDSGKISPEADLKVQAIDLVSELPERVDLLKLDIEGAEYKVLRHLCQTGAINRVEAFVAEFHVWRTHIDEMLAVLSQLRAAGMTLCFSAEPCPWIGMAPDASPFYAIGHFQMLMMVYGWQSVEAAG